MEDCVFCSIIKGEIPTDILYQDGDFIIIKDINPMAKIHLLAIPKVHFPLLSMQTEEGVQVVSRIIHKISELAEQLGLKRGYRLMINQGEDAGQTVAHLHIHILGGENLDARWIN